MIDQTFAHDAPYYAKRLRDNFKGARGCNVGLAENEISLKYHDTVVARYYFDVGTLVLNHGGWMTYYTKERINRFCDVLSLHVSVYQRAKVWYVERADTGKTLAWGSINAEFSDDGRDVALEYVWPQAATASEAAHA